MILSASVVSIAALAAASVSAAPAPQVQGQSADFVLFNSTQAANMLSRVQNAYASHKTTSLLKSAFAANSQTGTTSSSNLVKYATFAGAAAKIVGTEWTCSGNCASPATVGTIVDYHWDTDGITSFGTTPKKLLSAGVEALF
ncbi:hypothetical protein GQ54DRAFT_307398 [Martensiomyces pterosporus]|nr:hypothetical protein GQ54DRAFT_307398 [Martensiomyces pterosporus]